MAEESRLILREADPENSFPGAPEQFTTGFNVTYRKLPCGHYVNVAQESLHPPGHCYKGCKPPSEEKPVSARKRATKKRGKK